MPSKSLHREPTFDWRPKSLQSPLHYNPKPFILPKLEPIKRPPPPERKQPTLEERKEIIHERLRTLEAMKLELEDYREKVRLGLIVPVPLSSFTNPASSPESGHVSNRLSSLRNPEISKADPQRDKRTESSAEDAGAVQILAPRSMYALKGKPLLGGKAEDVKHKNSPSTCQDDHVRDLQSNIEQMKIEPEKKGHDKSIMLLYQRIQAMRLGRNSRQGVALHRHEDAAAELSPSIVQFEHVEEIQSMIQVKKKKLTAQEVQESKRLFHLKLEALDLRRNGPRSTPLHQSEDRATRTSRYNLVSIKSSVLRGCHHPVRAAEC